MPPNSPTDGVQNVAGGSAVPPPPIPPPPPAPHATLQVPHKPVADVPPPPPPPQVAAMPVAPSTPSDSMVFADLIPPDVIPSPVPSQFGVSVPVMPDVAQSQAPVAPSAPAPVVVAPVAPVELTIDEKIAKEEATQHALLERRKRIESESEQYFTSRKELEEQLAPILLDEKLAIERVDALEKKKQEALTPEAKRTVEEARWKEEEGRRTIEESKWPISEKLEVVVGKIKEGESAFRELLAEEAQSKSRIEKLRIEAKQRDLHLELSAITARREATEEELEQFHLERNRLEAQLHDTKEIDEVALKEEHVVDAKADTARTLYEERVLSEERHKLELERREAEKKRWEAEDAIPTVSQSVVESQAKLEVIKKEEAEVLAKLKALGA